jgi:uncharacterized membrane protein YgcG
MDPIDLQIQQQIADLQQQPNFAGYQPSFVEDPMIPVPKPVVAEANVPNPVTQTIGGIKDLVVKNFNPRQSFLNYAASKAFGKTGAAVLGAGLGILPFAAPMIKKAAGAVGRALRPDPQQQGIAAYINQVYGTTPTGQISTGPMAGYNTQGAFGSIGALDTAIGRIGRIAKARSKRDTKTLADRQKALEGYVSNVQKEITKQKGGIGADRLKERDKPNMNIPDRNRGQISARSTPSRSSNIPDRGRGQTGGGSRGGGSRGGRSDGRGGANPHR